MWDCGIRVGSVSALRGRDVFALRASGDWGVSTLMGSEGRGEGNSSLRGSGVGASLLGGTAGAGGLYSEGQRDWGRGCLCYEGRWRLCSDG